MFSIARQLHMVFLQLLQNITLELLQNICFEQINFNVSNPFILSVQPSNRANQYHFNYNNHCTILINLFKILFIILGFAMFLCNNSTVLSLARLSCDSLMTILSFALTWFAIYGCGLLRNPIGFRRN